MNYKPTYSVAIVGAGRIGCGFDSPDSPHVLTHAHAVAGNPRTTLVAIVEPDSERGKREGKKWQAPLFGSLDDMFASVKPDIVIIATPDATHTEVLERVYPHSPGLIICEKPVASTAADAQRVRALSKDIPVIVNFSRRFDTTVQELAQDIQSGRYGTIISASGLYGKGILHNGCHVIDTARYLFGEMLSSVPHFSVDDFPEGEPSVGSVASFERCEQFYLMAADWREYSILELDILAEKARLRFTDEGRTLSVHDIVADPLYDGYKILGEPQMRTTGLIHSIEKLIRHSVAILDGTEVSLSTIDNALMSEAACRSIARGLKRV